MLIYSSHLMLSIHKALKNLLSHESIFITTLIFEPKGISENVLVKNLQGDSVVHT